jgi:two-component system, NarL family, nitrate/nitrite response regulator NarL
VNVKHSIVLASASTEVIQRWEEAVAEEAEVTVCSSKPELVRNLDSVHPDQYFLDLELPELHGLTGALSLIPRHSRSLCLAFSTVPTDNEGLQLLKTGARAYCNRYIAPRLLTTISTLVASGEVWLGASIMEQLIKRIESPASGQSPNNPLNNLTEREREIALLVAEGDNNKNIAGKLDISERTVKAHLTSIFHKTESKDRLQLALLVKEII